MLLVLPHGHEAGTGGEDFVAEATLVVGLLNISTIIIALLLGLLGVVWSLSVRLHMRRSVIYETKGRGGQPTKAEHL